MEVDEVPRSSGQFNLDRATQEHINEGLEMCITPEPVSSVRDLEAEPIRPLMEVTLPGYTPSSTPGSSQISGSSSRLKELPLRNRFQHAAGLLEHLKSDAPTPKKIWEAIQTLFTAMNEVQENVTSRFGAETKVAFTTSPGTRACCLRCSLYTLS